MSFSYNSAVPQAGDNPAVSQGQMLTNFGSISSIIAVDHVGFNAAKGGYHNQVNFVNQSVPATLNGDSMLYSSSGNLYFQNGSITGGLQMTGAAPTIGAKGSTSLPGGLILKWGGDTTGAGANTIVTYSVAFPTTCFSVIACLATNISAVWTTLVTNNGVGSFTIYFNTAPGAGKSISWLAIGN
jgi:hypothetical protein